MKKLFAKREYVGQTENGNDYNGRWVVREADGKFVEVEKYSNDLRDRYSEAKGYDLEFIEPIKMDKPIVVIVGGASHRAALISELLTRELHNQVVVLGEDDTDRHTHNPFAHEPPKLEDFFVEVKSHDHYAHLDKVGKPKKYFDQSHSIRSPRGRRR